MEKLGSGIAWAALFLSLAYCGANDATQKTKQRIELMRYCAEVGGALDLKSEWCEVQP